MNKVIKCAVCGNEFVSTHSKNVYCSVECRRANAKYREAEQKGVELFTQGTLKTCVICGKEFAAQRRNHLCCSPECTKEQKARKFRTYQERKQAGLVVPRKTNKREKKESHSLTVEKSRMLREQGITYAEWQIAQTLAMVEPVRTVL